MPAIVLTNAQATLYTAPATITDQNLSTGGVPAIASLATAVTSAGTGTDISQYLNKVTLDIKAEDKETTTFGSISARSYQVGLASDKVSLTVLPDTAQALYNLLANSFQKTVAIVVKPTNSAVSASNPAWVANILVSDLAGLSGSVGEVVTNDLSYQVTGPISRATTA